MQTEQNLLREQRQKAYTDYQNARMALERVFDSLIAFRPNSNMMFPYPQEIIENLHKARDAEGDNYTQVLLLAPKNIRDIMWSLTNYYGLKTQGYEALQKILMAHPIDQQKLMSQENYLFFQKVVFNPYEKDRKEVDCYDAVNQLIYEMSKDLGNV
ncbi:Uncharacterised protein [Mycobacteroides abscessus subsp. massiliense]|nr:Uncharacterised protein [Mycobacteroides abscessus subsp. massiliense]SKR73693.1 Uncharacterised protein [Mycobacteroides abscessus subsp. massiliense]SKT61640.1 Uncharacterised protein [Mycobacteroides abscessus subsp. massiliense]SKT94508.1 Uncharacterised protein [Mycobacteroides abscessus subsp. massiliense]SLA44082.1 Uncharacterised protein [Mycobacteroides abscessus subsp. massiliense]